MTLYRCVDFSWKIKKLLNIGSDAMLRKSLKVVDEFVYNLIKSKTETVANSGDDLHVKRRDILSRLLESGQTDPKYLRDIIFSLIVARKDTTASTLTWFIYVVCKHPDIQEKIAQEVREATNVKYNSSIAELADNLTEETLGKMQYLVAALTETSRLYPAVPLAGPRICVGKDFAYREMMIFCAVLLGSYIFKLRDENKEAELQDQVHSPY